MQCSVRINSTADFTLLAAVSHVIYGCVYTAVECNCISFLHIYIPYIHVADNRLLKAETSWRYVNVDTEIRHKAGNVCVT